ncbi:MAG: hypothetical protein AAB400_01370 [Patescibacteria group bacterium]
MKPIFRWIIAGMLIALSSVGFYYWNAYESERSYDLQIVSQVASMKDSLSLYAQQYAAYPHLQDPFLQRFGFLAAAYVPLLADSSTECQSQSRCPSYRVRFLLKTNVIYPKGEHIVTPSGIQ